MSSFLQAPAEPGRLELKRVTSQFRDLFFQSMDFLIDQFAGPPAARFVDGIDTQAFDAVARDVKVVVSAEQAL